LNYNKLVRHHFPLVPVDPLALLNELVASYPQFQEARASISIREPMEPVLGNPALLTQCLSNLLDNALKFVAPGATPAVAIYSERRNPRVRLWVQDNGIGIAPEHGRRIFEMFQRLNTEYVGTGIGLALVKKAAERMGGAVGFESEPGQGSRFWLDLQPAREA
jgi:signal transduction histidine kinase